MSDRVPEQIPSRENYHESPEIRRFMIHIEQACQLTSLKLEFKGIILKPETIRQILVPVIEQILENPTLSNDPRLIQVVQRHFDDFLLRLTLLDADKVGLYQLQRGIFEDVGYDRHLKHYTSEQKNARALHDIVESGMRASLLPQMQLLDRAFQKRALQYDYADFATLQSKLSQIDDHLPGGKSILDFILERGNGGKVNIALDQRLKTAGMEYIIDALNPPGALWLKQMAKNGNISPETRVQGYTDALVNGVVIDVVRLLIYYRAHVQIFQSKESELSSIRARATTTNSTFIPYESQNFPDLAPSSHVREQGMIEAAKNVTSGEEALRGILNITASILDAQYFVAGITGVSHDGRILRSDERVQEVLIGGSKAIALTLLFGKIIKFIGTPAWNFTKEQVKVLIELAKKYLLNTDFARKISQKVK